MLENLLEMILWHVYIIINIGWIVFEKSNILFGEMQDYFFVFEFQTGGLSHDHGL